MTSYTHILDLAKEAEPPADGILSHSIKARTPVVMLLVLLK